MRCRIKLCGINNFEDLELVAQEGADYGGVLVEIDSKRAVSFQQAQSLFKKPPLGLVMVTQGQTRERNLEMAETLDPLALQLHGEESPEHVSALNQRLDCEIWKVLHMPAKETAEVPDTDALVKDIQTYAEAGAKRIVIDARVIKDGKPISGGTGKPVDWSAAAKVIGLIQTPIILAGGLNPDNIIAALKVVRPYAVDCSSGVEAHRAKKDPALVKAFIQRVRVATSQDDDQE